MTSTRRNIKNVPWYVIGSGALASVPALVEARRPAARTKATAAVFLIDEFFEAPAQAATLSHLGVEAGDAVHFIGTAEEPTTAAIDELIGDLRADGHESPCAVIGMGGGVTLDTAKAVSNLFTNPGHAADYQGWDLIQHPGGYKIGIPTISGTGAESSRTCVMTNVETALKLGMNSDHTLFDQLVLDPDLTATVERNQFFFTGMDAYVHCIESLAGGFRNPIADAYSAQALRLCRQVFLEGDMMTAENRERLMTASYLGGCALASSFVGVVHPMSAGLSVVLGIHHCVANCITILALDEFYPDACREFREAVRVQDVTIPDRVCADVTEAELTEMCAAAALHEKPLANALGPAFKDILTSARMKDLFRRM